MVKEDNGLKQSSTASVESSSKRRRAAEPLERTLSRCMKEKEELEKVRRVRRRVGNGPGGDMNIRTMKPVTSKTRLGIMIL
ncbi:hypothetical protein F2Q69_00001854 [Brassica cretica]|uniref:Uncharacterized protein n=1 Tax=Brassica cretica TaxID=69181 RepID=A0A8S9P7M9_BRACR|nr:hypothetical protein F2Q69_00001854 [Brassica cretica]